MPREWIRKYHAYESRCVKAAMLPIGPKRTAALRRLSKQYKRLREEMPTAPVPPATDAAFEEVCAELQVSLLFNAGSALDRMLLDLWLDGACQGPQPPVDHDVLRSLVTKVVWTRDLAVRNVPSGVAPETSSPSEYSDPDNYDRNKWLYEIRKAGRSLPEIHVELGIRCQDVGWYPLDSESGIRDAIRSFATFHHLDVPVGKPGRPRNQRAKPANPPAKPTDLFSKSTS